MTYERYVDKILCKMYAKILIFLGVHSIPVSSSTVYSGFMETDTLFFFNLSLDMDSLAFISLRTNH